MMKMEDAIENTPQQDQSGKKPARFRDYIRIARPDHWIKNLFIFPGFFAALVLTSHRAIRPVLDPLLALVATSLVASANYVINEWLDASSTNSILSRKTVLSSLPT